jgi:hypothetical protein
LSIEKIFLKKKKKNHCTLSFRWTFGSFPVEALPTLIMFLRSATFTLRPSSIKLLMNVNTKFLVIINNIVIKNMKKKIKKKIKKKKSE